MPWHRVGAACPQAPRLLHRPGLWPARDRTSWSTRAKVAQSSEETQEKLRCCAALGVHFFPLWDPRGVSYLGSRKCPRHFGSSAHSLRSGERFGQRLQVAKVLSSALPGSGALNSASNTDLPAKPRPLASFPAFLSRHCMPDPSKAHYLGPTQPSGHPWPSRESK